MARKSKNRYPKPERGTVAEALASQRSGWIIGHFMPEGSMAHTHAVEVRLWHHPIGTNYGRKAFHGEELIVVFRGKLRFEIGDSDDDVDMYAVAEGEYIILPAGVTKRVVPLADSSGITVRWPSLPGHNRIVEAPR